MWYYVKQSFLAFMYLIFMALISFAILMIEVPWLKIILNIANVGLYLAIVCSASFRDGEMELRVRVANDIERKEIIRTGEDRPLKLKEEYKPWKGFVFGLIACVPLVALLLIHTVLVNFVDPTLNGAGIASSLIYATFYSFASLFFGEFATWHYYFTLIAIPIIACGTGIPYIMGGKKIEAQQRVIKEKQRQIYGDKI